MTIESTLYAVLSGVAQTYPLYLPENPTLPAITYQRIAETPTRTHNAQNFEDALMQIDCWSPTYATARSLADSVQAVLDLNKTNFIFAYKINSLHLDEKDTGLFHVVEQYRIWK